MCLALHFPGSPSDVLTVSRCNIKVQGWTLQIAIYWQQFVERSRDKPYLAHPPRQLLHISFLLVLVSSNSVCRLALKKGSHAASRINGWFWILCTQTAVSSRDIERLLSETKASLEWKEFRGHNLAVIMLTHTASKQFFQRTRKFSNFLLYSPLPVFNAGEEFLKLFALMQIASMSALGRRLPFGPLQYCSSRCSPSRNKSTPGVGGKECYRNRSRTLTVNWEKLVFGHSTSLGNSQE